MCSVAFEHGESAKMLIASGNFTSALCSGLMNPDTNQGGNITIIEEVFNDQKEKIIYPGIQTGSGMLGA